MRYKLLYMDAARCINIFQQVVEQYHFTNDVDAPVNNPYEKGAFDHLLYQKCWIDTVQWHLEDSIREPAIEPIEALNLKRRIDRSNQERTDMVERIDDWFLHYYKDVKLLPEASLNTESPAWAIDRLSILALKVYHMAIEANREEATEEHRNTCRKKLDVLLEQQQDLSAAIDQLLKDIAGGHKYMKVYRQMKMYNDDALNPVLYSQKNKQP